MTTDPLDELDRALNATAYEWLEAQNPGLLHGVEKALADGLTPKSIRARVLRRTYNDQLARRCEAAAWHLMSMEATV